MKLHISPGNDKLGDTPNLSMLPIVTCAPDVPCKKKCYALKRCNGMFKNVVYNWSENLMYWEAYPERFATDLHKFLLEEKPQRFRWFVGGDIPDPTFWRLMRDVAYGHEDTKFLCFTKKYEYVTRKPDIFNVPDNLMVFASMWPGYRQLSSAANRKYRQRAWFVPKGGRDFRMPTTGVFICPGSCPECGYKCWDRATGDVAFNEH